MQKCERDLCETDLEQQLASRYHVEKDAQLSSYADWYFQAYYVYSNLPDRHPKKIKWLRLWQQRKQVWERYLDVLARDEHYHATETAQTLNF